MESPLVSLIDFFGVLVLGSIVAVIIISSLYGVACGIILAADWLNKFFRNR